MRPLSLLPCLVAIACGGTQTPVAEEPAPARPVSRPEREDGMIVEGEMGSISRMAVDSTMSNHLDGLSECYRQALPSLPYLAGEVVLGFRIDRSGHVRWAHVVTSSLGHHETERCLADRGARIRFPSPQGGEAEFTYPLEFNPGSGRPPEIWTADHVTEALGEHVPEIQTCGVQGGGFSLTMYVNRGGAVTAAGVSSPGHESVEAAECVARAATGWTMPDPGSWVAKVTVDLP